MTTKTLTKADLAQFTRSETWHQRAIVRDVLFTDGAKHVADANGAYWLLDEFVLAQRYKRRVAPEEVQVWTQKVEDARATLTCDDGNGNGGYSKRIPFTDFPLDGISLDFCNQRHPVAERVLIEAGAAYEWRLAAFSNLI